MTRSSPLHTPEYSHDFAQYSHGSLDGLFELLYEVDKQIADCATLLNRSQPLISGKIGIGFGVVQRHSNGLELVEPYRVRLFQQKNLRNSRWVMRRVSASILAQKQNKSEGLLVKGLKHQVKGVTRTITLENTKVSVAACRTLDRLFEMRGQIKKTISSVNASYALLARSQQSLQQKSAAILSKSEKELEVDFSKPDLAYKHINKKIQHR